MRRSVDFAADVRAVQALSGGFWMRRGVDFAADVRAVQASSGRCG